MVLSAALEKNITQKSTRSSVFKVVLYKSSCMTAAFIHLQIYLTTTWRAFKSPRCAQPEG